MRGRIMSDTSEFAQAVNAAARLSKHQRSPLNVLSQLKKPQMLYSSDSHQTDSYFKNIVAQGKVAEAIPNLHGASTCTSFQFVELLFCIFIKARHTVNVKCC